MEKIEYKKLVEQYEPYKSMPSLEDDATEFAKEGWRLIAVCGQPGSRVGTLERRIIQHSLETQQELCNEVKEAIKKKTKNITNVIK